MQDFILREAELADEPVLLEFEQKVVEAERPYNSAIKSGDVFYYDLPALLASENSYLVVTEADSRVVGSGYAQLRESKKSLTHDVHSYLGFMYVEPEYRGCGINKKIVEELIRWSKSQGTTDFYLDVYAGNEAAIRAYEKAGFVRSMIEMKLHLD